MSACVSYLQPYKTWKWYPLEQRDKKLRDSKKCNFRILRSFIICCFDKGRMDLNLDSWTERKFRRSQVCSFCLIIYINKRMWQILRTRSVKTGWDNRDIEVSKKVKEISVLLEIHNCSFQPFQKKTPSWQYIFHQKSFLNSTLKSLFLNKYTGSQFSRTCHFKNWSETKCNMRGDAVCTIAQWRNHIG